MAWNQCQHNVYVFHIWKPLRINTNIQETFVVHGSNVELRLRIRSTNNTILSIFSMNKLFWVKIHLWISFWVNSEGHLLIVFCIESNVNVVDYPSWNDSLRMEIFVNEFLKMKHHQQHSDSFECFCRRTRFEIFFWQSDKSNLLKNGIQNGFSISSLLFESLLVSDSGKDARLHFCVCD